TIKQFQQNDPRLAQIQSPEELINYFKQAYQRYYVPRSVDPNAWGQRPGGPMFSRPSSGGGGVTLQSLVEQYGGENATDIWIPRHILRETGPPSYTAGRASAATRWYLWFPG